MQLENDLIVLNVVFLELAKLQNPKKADANMTTWLLVAETCVRILQKDFDFEGKNAAFDTFDQFLTYLCKTFKIEDATSNKLINKYNQVSILFLRIFSCTYFWILQYNFGVQLNVQDNR